MIVSDVCLEESRTSPKEMQTFNISWDFMDSSLKWDLKAPFGIILNSCRLEV